VLGIRGTGETRLLENQAGGGALPDGQGVVGAARQRREHGLYAGRPILSGRVLAEGAKRFDQIVHPGLDTRQPGLEIQVEQAAWTGRPAQDHIRIGTAPRPAQISGASGSGGLLVPAAVP